MKFSLVAVSAILSSLVFASPAALTSPALAIRAATKPDNGDLVGQDFELIANQTTLLNQTLTQFHKSGRSVIIAYRIRKQALAAKATLNKIIVDTNNSRRFSYNSTYSAVAGFLDSFAPIRASLLNLDSKKRAVAAAVFGFGDLSKTVYQVVSELRNLTLTLAPVLVAHLDPETGLQDEAPGFVSQLDALFNQTLAVYKSCSGQVCLPAIPDSFPV